MSDQQRGQAVYSMYRASLAIALALAIAQPATRKKLRTGRDRHRNQIGQTMPYSGPLSAFGTIGKAQAAYFE